MTSAENPAEPPVAPRVPVERRLHGDVFVDGYAWMRERSDPRLLGYLEAENAWADAATAPLRHLHGTLHAELVATIAPTDRSVSWDYGRSVYYTCTPEGSDYAQHLRHPRSGAGGPSDSEGRAEGQEAPAELLLDENVEAGDGDYFAVGDVEISPDERLLAWTADRDGSERFTLLVRNLVAGTDRPDRVAPVYYGVAWEDGESLLYTVPDDANRPFQVRRHRVGTAVSADELVVEEPDRRFELTVRRLRSGRFSAIRSASRETSEVWLVPSGGGAPVRVLPRRHGVEYDVDDPGGSHVLVLTNDCAEDFRVLAVPLDGSGPGRVVVAGEPGTRFDQLAAFDGFAVVRARRGGGTLLRVVDVGSGAAFDAEPPIPLGVVALGTNAEAGAREVTVSVDGPLTPRRHYAVDLHSGAWRLRHVEPVPTFDPDRYVAERITATAEDGTGVPITVVRHRGTPVDGTAPCLVTGYGAYESSFDPEFDRAWLPLLDRGAVCAIAHVRGGGKMGRRWWLDGHLAAKQNTFGDFIACVRHLVAAGYADPRRVAARGLSAGGLLMGAVFSQAPGLFRAVVAEAPFVDVVTTMCDAFRVPVGVAAIVTAGNFPVAVPSWYLVPALVCGNAAVWKPAEYAAASAQAFFEMIVAAGVPDGVVNLVFADGEATFAGLDAALGEGSVDKVGFTGSSAVGVRIGELAGRHLQSACLELGGKNPMVVTPSADLDLAVEGALFSGFGTAGQRCTSLGTVIVHRSVHDQFLRRFSAAVSRAPMGDPTRDVVLGPLLEQRFADRFEEYLGWLQPHHTVHGSGGTGRITPDNPRSGFDGDPAEGLYYHPTIVSGVRPDDRLFLEETFGPIVGVTAYDMVDEAIALANRPGYGLSSSIYTTDPQDAFRFRAGVSAGMVSVNNSTSGAEAHLPFGGNGRSGNGSRQSGMWVLDQFTKWQSLNWDYSGRLQKAQMDVATVAPDYGFRLAP